MASLQQIQSRRKAVKNVGQITKAMEVVATTKMRRSQEVALRSRPYAYKVLELLDRISHYAPLVTPLTQKREIKRTLVVIMTSDRGLIGSFNSQMFKHADSFFEKDEYADKSEHEYDVVTVGKKATNYAKKKGFNIVESFQDFGDHVASSEIQPLTDILTQGYEKGTYDRVITISMHFRSTLKQEVIERQMLPVDFEKIRQTVEEIIPESGKHAGEESGRVEVKEVEDEEKYIFEPTPQEALKLLIPHLVTMQLYHLVLEANASEHSARRVAMKTASDNAVELSDTLTLQYNKARQAGITNEIIEITSTQNALN
ncbi:MAG: ATP synthase F1 subunit gamma [Parcubacteria group bacterium]